VKLHESLLPKASAPCTSCLWTLDAAPKHRAAFEREISGEKSNGKRNLSKFGREVQILSCSNTMQTSSRHIGSRLHIEAFWTYWSVPREKNLRFVRVASSNMLQHTPTTTPTLSNALEWVSYSRSTLQHGGACDANKPLLLSRKTKEGELEEVIISQCGAERHFFLLNSFISCKNTLIESIFIKIWVLCRNIVNLYLRLRSDSPPRCIQTSRKRSNSFRVPLVGA